MVDRSADQELPEAFALAISFLATLFGLANFGDMGEQEYFYSGTDPLFYIRRGGCITKNLPISLDII